ncbi:hypothetical protein DFH29DRAFT_961318 [Suillus ampliporus]|nr:hypothetical protein DFH29DRAFT_961318 [Suillus ampliporus]
MLVGKNSEAIISSFRLVFQTLMENLDLVEERDYYRAKCATGITQLALLENEVEGLKTELKDSKRRVVQLQNDNEQQLQTRTTATTALEYEVTELKKTLDDAKRHAAQLQKVNEQLHEQVSDCERQLHDRRLQESMATGVASVPSKTSALPNTSASSRSNNLTPSRKTSVPSSASAALRSNVLSPSSAPSNVSASIGASVTSKPRLEKRKRLVSEQLPAALPAILHNMWRLEGGLELPSDTISQDVKNCSLLVSSAKSTPVSIDLLQRLHMRILDFSLGGYIPAAPGQPGLILVWSMDENIEHFEAFMPVRGHPHRRFYCGTYRCTVIRELSVKEFNDHKFGVRLSLFM